MQYSNSRHKEASFKLAFQRYVHFWSCFVTSFTGCTDLLLNRNIGGWCVMSINKGMYRLPKIYCCVNLALKCA